MKLLIIELDNLLAIFTHRQSKGRLKLEIEMGDRANVVVKSGAEQVCLYTHWDGTKLPDTLKDALKRGKSRWDDFQYLTRIIFQQMIGKDDGLTGFGITQVVHDNEHEILVVDCDKQTVNGIAFSDYIA